jgi:hypothetical protein
MKFEGIDGVLIEGCAKDDPRSWRRQRCGNFQSTAGRHLDIQKHQIWPQFQNLLDRLLAILGLANDLHIIDSRQELAQTASGGFLIIHH